MKKKKEKIGPKDLLEPINCIGEEVLGVDTSLSLEDNSNYILIKHPFIKNKLIFIRCSELFTLNGILISLRNLIKESKIIDTDIQTKVDDLSIGEPDNYYSDLDNDYNNTFHYEWSLDRENLLRKRNKRKEKKQLPM